MSASERAKPLSDQVLAELGPQVRVPTYDRSQVKVGIAHFGVGGFHRSHQAMYLDSLMNQSTDLDWGICGVGIMPSDQRMKEALAGQDCLYTLLTRHPSGQVDAQVIGSLVRYVYGPDDPEAVLAVLADPGVRIVSLTVTEGGYNINQVTGEFDIDQPAVVADLASGAVPSTVFGYLVEALRRRRERSLAPFTVMSCDNVQHNGEVARSSLLAFAQRKDPVVAEWIASQVAFPSCMVDRITPVTAPTDVEQLRDQFGVEDAWPVVCEPFTQWALEDHFTGGRPALEKAGVQLTDDVAPYELMKLRLLNASHQAIAYHGHLAGYTYADQAAADPIFAEFIVGYMQQEARPTLAPVPGVDLDNYISTIVSRFANPAIKDTIARLAAYGSDRIPKWVVPIVQANLASGRPVARAVAIIASWARYCEGTDEHGGPIQLVDNLADELASAAKRQSSDPLAFVRNQRLFGDLADNHRFADMYTRALGRLHEVGARQALRELDEH